MFLVLEIKYLDRRNVRKSELVLAQSLRLQSITMGQECRTSGQTLSKGKLKAVHSCFAPLVICMHSRIPAQDTVLF